ncbi:GNAT family N-acetyltransferase [Chelatococcus reniformis]|uniref:Alanine acetyltransferase n=1 Tax=Chelatococcus reniformis TaxID=1494448 RepID=A0A916TYX1_9HYPH|nr:GNAT family N-acetyltransferase [Chelatococcus reniformis]GGC52044.1 alanine acetyltransferase [Chelatococcus reniformis]
MKWPWHRDLTGRVGRLAPVDAAALASIHAEGFARPWGAADFEQMLTDPAVVADGVRAPGRVPPAGFVLSRRVLDEAEILTIAVARRCRGRGYGRALLVSHMPRLAALGVRTLHLEVEDGNEPALALYRSLGFGQVGQRGGYYARPDGTTAGALLMARALG